MEDNLSCRNATVQSVLFHPFNDLQTLQVYNLVEKDAPFIAYYGGSSKPPAWGMAGGGYEGKEFELSNLADPLNPILSDKELTEEEHLYAAAGLREAIDESGYAKLNIWKEPRGGLYFLDYRYPDNTHRKVTLAGEVESLVRRPVKEVEEIGGVQWIDLAEPIVTQYAGVYVDSSHPRFGLPYWSHIRRTLLTIAKLDRNSALYNRHIIGNRIHSSWRLVFPIGKGDARFPRSGYVLSPDPGSLAFYKFLQELIHQKIADVDRDLVYEVFKDEIDLRREAELKQLEIDATMPDDSQTETIPPREEAILLGGSVTTPSDTDDDENSTDDRNAMAMAEKRIRMAEATYYDSYKEWMEATLRDIGEL